MLEQRPSSNSSNSKSTFNHASYALFRPTYPVSLYQALLKYHDGPRVCLVDLGCGHGVVAHSLDKYFNKVIGIDPSLGMIEQAKKISSTDYPKVYFRQSAAESLPFIEDGSVDMVVAGQAAHWFDYPKFFPEMQRILRKSGTLALWGYKDPVFVDYPKATKILIEYAYGMDERLLGPYWSQPGRSIVENKLRDILPPLSDWEDLQRIEYEPGTNGPESGEGTIFLHRKLKLGDCMDYIRTWSAVNAWQENHPDHKKREEGGMGDVVDRMFDKMKSVETDWGQGEEKELEVEWGTGLLLARRK